MIFNLYSQIENGMVAHFQFNGNCQDILNSSIVSINNGVTFVDGRNSDVGGAADLSNEKHVTFNDDAVKAELPLTISFWINFNSFGYRNPIFYSDNVYDVYYGYTVTASSDGKIWLTITDGLGVGSTHRRSFNSNQSLSIGKWYHIVGVFRSASDMDLYIDCVKAAGIYSGTGNAQIMYSSSDSKIGSRTGIAADPYDRYLNASVDQLVIWDRELSVNEITYLCDTYNDLKVEEHFLQPKTLVKIVDVLGRETEKKLNQVLFYIYSDGTSEKVFLIE